MNHVRDGQECSLRVPASGKRFFTSLVVFLSHAAVLQMIARSTDTLISDGNMPELCYRAIP